MANSNSKADVPDIQNAGRRPSNARRDANAGIRALEHVRRNSRVSGTVGRINAVDG